MTPAAVTSRRSIRDGMFMGNLAALEDLRLTGSRCRVCSVTSFTRSELCPNCGASDVQSIALSQNGELATFSVLRHAPPGDYRGAVPFEPFAVGLVNLPEGVGIVSPLMARIEDLSIGMAMRLSPHILYRDGDMDVVAFRFAPLAPKEDV